MKSNKKDGVNMVFKPECLQVSGVKVPCQTCPVHSGDGGACSGGVGLIFPSFPIGNSLIVVKDSV